MTYEEYLKKVYNERPREQRLGQWAWNLLSEEQPTLTTLIKVWDDHDIDPFYDDKNMAPFLGYVAANWHA